MELKSLSFREKRKESWRRLEKLLFQMEQKGIQSLSPSELMEVANLYRTACSSLSIARNISLDKNLHEYLENLVTQGYLHIYCTKPVRERAIRHYFLSHFPSLIRKYFYYHLFAFVFLFLGIIVGYFLTASDPGYFYTFVDRSLAEGRTPYSSKESLAKSLHEGRETEVSHRTVFSSFLFTHNTKIGFLCFSLGIILGLPTLYFLFYNGTMLGAMSYIYHKQGLSLEWWAWVLPHGITEFLAIILCGGGGLLIGVSLFSRGKHGQMYELKSRGKDAGLMVMGTVALFFIAALLEGYFRQSSLESLPRYLVGASSLLFWIVYFAFVGKDFHVQSGTKN